MTGRIKPSIFISSTIRDFEDMRGSLRFWLKEAGFDVWLSEYTDIEKRPDLNALDACFESVRKADFYVLLIGDKKGTAYDDQTSVTQQEYRVAYEGFAGVGHPLPILFVRSRTKTILDEWKRSGCGEPPPFHDAPFVAQFIAEVSKEREAADAAKGIEPYPLANWLHAFSDLEDIIDALKGPLSLRIDVPTQRILATIEAELEMALSRLVHRTRLNLREPAAQPMRTELKEGLLQRGHAEETVEKYLDGWEKEWPFPDHWYMNSVAKEVEIDAQYGTPVVLNREQTIRLSMYLAGGTPTPEGLSLTSVQRAVQEGLLLSYDPATRRFRDTELSLAALELLKEAERYRMRHRGLMESLTRVMTTLASANRAKAPNTHLSWMDALTIWSVYYSQVNLYRWVARIYAYIRGLKDSPVPDPDSLMPLTPLGEEEAEKIRRGQASRVDIRQWSDIPEFWKL